VLPSSALFTVDSLPLGYTLISVLVKLWQVKVVGAASLKPVSFQTVNMSENHCS